MRSFVGCGGGKNGLIKPRLILNRIFGGGGRALPRASLIVERRGRLSRSRYNHPVLL